MQVTPVTRICHFRLLGGKTRLKRGGKSKYITASVDSDSELLPTPLQVHFLGAIIAPSVYPVASWEIFLAGSYGNKGMTVWFRKKSLSKQVKESAGLVMRRGGNGADG